MSLVTRLLTGPKPPHTLIAPNPRLASMRTMRIFFLFFTLFIGGYIVVFDLISFFFLNGMRNFSWAYTPILLLISMFIFNAVFASISIHYWKRIDVCRFYAALRNPGWLADEQPQLHFDALQLPIKIAVSTVMDYSLYVVYVWIFWHFLWLPSIF